MPDIIRQNEWEVPKSYTDLGNGSYAEKIALEGGAASGATDIGFPVKVGGRYNSTPPSLSSGQRADLQIDAAGRLKTSSIPKASSVTIMSLTTAGSGSGWTTFGAQACDILEVINNTGTTIEYRRGGAGNSLKILSGTSRLISGITNANQIDVRRTDQSTTTVVVEAEAIQG